MVTIGICIPDSPQAYASHLHVGGIHPYAPFSSSCLGFSSSTLEFGLSENKGSLEVLPAFVLIVVNLCQTPIMKSNFCVRMSKVVSRSKVSTAGEVA